MLYSMNGETASSHFQRAKNAASTFSSFTGKLRGLMKDYP